LERSKDPHEILPMWQAATAKECGLMALTLQRFVEGVLSPEPADWKLQCSKCARSFLNAQDFKRHLRWCFGQRQMRPTAQAVQMSLDWGSKTAASWTSPTLTLIHKERIDHAKRI
jgi:hypothetical protein